MGNTIDITDQRFGRLQARRVVSIGKRGDKQWECECDCGGKKIATTGQLRAGNIKSCGCLLVEAGRKLRSYRNPKPPPKHAAVIVGGRPIDRLKPEDRDRVRANAAAFLAWIQRRKEIKKVLADVANIE